MVARQDTRVAKLAYNNRLFQEAEERVYNWLHEAVPELRVIDCRKQKTYYDFLLGSIFPLDVKCDQYAADTGRLAFEWEIDKDGRTVPGWGQHEGLAFIAYVLPDLADKQWPMYVVDAAMARVAVREWLESAEPVDGINVIQFAVQSEGREARGYGLGIEWLRERGALVWETIV